MKTLLLLLAAILPLAASDAAQLAIGRDLYRENCSVCHDIERDKAHSRKFGPSLNHLFKNETLPMSHGKPNRPYVVVRIKYGGSLMPAFAKRLNQSEIDTLVDYLASK